MSSSAHEIIGGLFGLEPATMARGFGPPPFAGSCLSYFLNARCAVYGVCQSVQPRTVWLPSYLCSAILDPFRNLAVPIRYYDAGPNLETHAAGWIADVAPGDLVLLIHYFGFPNAAFPAGLLKGRGAAIIEDASQGLFIKQQYSESICIVYSPRKFLGVPDGGLMAYSRSNALDFGLLEPPPIEWWKSALAVTQMRREFDLLGGENLWFSLYREVEDTCPVGPYRSSDITRVVIETGTDYDFIKRVRRENYLALRERLKEFALFPELDTETVPLGFPVCVDAHRRDKVIDHLYSQRIYPPVHWHIEGIVPEQYRESHSLSQRILTLICDQRYTISDMMRQADAFISAIN
jgi:hypothetical protein